MIEEIVVVMNKGGVIEEMYGSPNLLNSVVDVIDFCTDDPDEEDDAWSRYNDVSKEIEMGNRVRIY